MKKVTKKIMLTQMGNTDNWSTPPAFYKKLDKEFNFNFDPCPLNPKFDGLDIPWHGNVFCNPPYSNIRAWIEKAINEVNKGNTKVAVILTFARTDTMWFHELVYGKYEVRFIRGRLCFGGAKNPAPFPSMLIIIKKFKVDW